MSNNSETMKALVLTEYNKDYELQEITKPIPNSNQVLVRIKASAINPLDVKIKAGTAAHSHTTLPAILGLDMAGVVEAVGSEVINFKPGDEVYGMTGGVGGIQGSLAEYAAVDPDLLALKPATLTMKEAAALPLAFITAWEGLIEKGNLSVGQMLLIQGGSGSVGHVAIQIAIAKGAKVFATGSSKNLAMIESYGATAIDYTKIKPEEYINLANGDGFDVILDTAGGEDMGKLFEAVKVHTGHVVSILGRGSYNLTPLSLRGASYSGVMTLTPLITGIDRKRQGAIMQQATMLADAGKLKPFVDATSYTFESITAAYQAFENHTAAGKVVIDI